MSLMVHHKTRAAGSSQRTAHKNAGDSMAFGEYLPNTASAQDTVSKAYPADSTDLNRDASMAASVARYICNPGCGPEPARSNG